jgi:adenylylsulfate kinase
MEATNIKWHRGLLKRGTRWGRLSCRGATFWLTGLPASGKSTIASALEYALVMRGIHAYRLDGDNVRHGLNSNLGFSREDRAENIRRIGEVAKLFADSGCIAITAFISPYLIDRENIRRMHKEADLAFLEVFVDCPVQECIRRDPKGQYRQARAGKITGFTGVDDPYEAPLLPDLVLKTAKTSVEECVRACMDVLAGRNLITSAD